MGKLRDRLVALGLRKEGDFTLHSGVKSDVFWDIKELYGYPYWMRMEAIREFVWAIGLLQPSMLMGIKTGGQKLADDIGECLGIYVLNEEGSVRAGIESKRKMWGDTLVIIDDVLTTGNTVRSIARRAIDNAMIRANTKTACIAVLINRSGMTELDGIPVISGVVTDIVEGETWSSG